MTKKELKAMVDEGYALDQKIKADEKELKEIKNILKAAASEKKLRELNGFERSALVSPSATSSADTKDAHKLYLDCGHSTDKFLEICAVSIPQLRKQVGEILADEIVTTKTNAYGKIAFRKDLVK